MYDHSTNVSKIRRIKSIIKAFITYAFLACVGEENARGFAFGKLHAIFLSDLMMEYSENVFIINK